MEKYFEEYRDISLKLLEELDKEGFSGVEKFLKEKQEIILEVAKLDIDPEIVRNNLIKFEIIDLDEKIIEKMASKKREIKEKINEVGKRKSANNVYTNTGRQVQFLNSVR